MISRKKEKKFFNHHQASTYRVIIQFYELSAWKRARFPDPRVAVVWWKHLIVLMSALFYFDLSVSGRVT